MNHLLYNYFLRDVKKNLDMTILCVLHELRVATPKQIISFINTTDPVPDRTIRNHLESMCKEELILFFVSKEDKKTKIYHLTKMGYLSIAGYYPFPKVPEYNWYHSLMINDCLLETLAVIDNHPHLRYIQTERRQVYEVKDMEKSRNGQIFFVADFLARFNSPTMRNIDWYFEIELTIKTKKRYKKNIFVKYINHLTRYKDARVIYVSPTPTILVDLTKFKNEFYTNIEDRDIAEDIFSRFHFFSMEEFPRKLKELVETDTFINW